MSNLLLNISDEIIIGAINKSINKQEGDSLNSIYHICAYPSMSLSCHDNINYQFIDFWEKRDKLNKGSNEFTYMIDEVLLNKLARYEDFVLDMYSRMFYSKNIYRDYAFKKSLYFYQLSYWYDFLLSNKITHFICGNVPHEGFDYIIYLLAETLNIKVHFFFQIPFGKFIVAGSRIDKLFESIRKEYNRLLVDASKEVSLPGELESIWSRFNLDEVPFYSNSDKDFLFCVKNIVKKFLRPFLRRFKYKLYLNEVQDPFRKCCTEVDLALPYIYFGMHYQPEMTTLSMGGSYKDQFLAIKLLSENLPKGVMLYVKEHPEIHQTRSFLSRFSELYSLVTSLDNVRLVEPSLSTFELIKNSKAISTITGTVGWEGLFRGKPVIIFGEVYYKYCDGVFNVYEKEDLKKAINSIFNIGYCIDFSKLKLYILAIYNISIKSFSDSLYFYESGFVAPTKENKDICVDELSKYISQKIFLN